MSQSLALQINLLFPQFLKLFVYHHLNSGRLVNSQHIDFIHDFAFIAFFDVLNVVKLAFELQPLDVLGFVDGFLILGFLGTLHLLDLVEMLDGAEVVDDRLGVLGDGLDVVRAREPAVALFQRHLLDQFLLLPADLVGEQRVAWVADAHVLQLRLAAHDVFQLLFGVEFRVVQGVDAFH